MTYLVNNFNVFPLFPAVISVCSIAEDISLLESIKQTDFTAVYEEDINRVAISTTLDLLDEYTAEKHLLLDYFNRFKNSVLRLDSTEFDISSSWATRVSANINTKLHNHRNSFYSGVLYLDDLVSGGELQLTNSNINSLNFLTSPPSEYNIFNHEIFDIKPQKNRLIFFPSQLQHRITKHYMSDYRYSIAFNIVPVGNFGRRDSKINMQLIK